MFLLVPAHPGFPGQIPQSRKTVVCVCMWKHMLNLNVFMQNLLSVDYHKHWWINHSVLCRLVRGRELYAHKQSMTALKVSMLMNIVNMYL